MLHLIHDLETQNDVESADKDFEVSPELAQCLSLAPSSDPRHASRQGLQHNQLLPATF